MKKTGKKIGFWILSGLALILGVSCCDSAKLYGPPPPENVSDTIPGE